MKKTKVTILQLFVITAILFAGFNNSFAQRVVQVEQGFGTLNEAIASDTTATGERVDLNTVYQLERGGYYILNGSIQNSGYPLTIVAADGDGERPVLRPGCVEGGEASRCFKIKDDLTLKGLYITNMDEHNGRKSNIIRISADDLRVVIDDCMFDYDSQSGLRVDDPGQNIFITNSVFSNIGKMTSPDNGRAIDDRGSAIDTLWMVNNTFYNLTSNVLRDDGGTINYFKFDHNTVANIGQRGIDFGQAYEVEITNNIFYNVGILGQLPVETEFKRAVIVGDTLTGMISMKINNNNIFYDPEIAASLPDTIDMIPVYNPVLETLVNELGIGENTTYETVTFNIAPEVPTECITSFYSDPENAVNFDSGFASPAYGDVKLPFDFAYNEAAASYTGAEDGTQLGDLSWYGVVSDVDDNEVVVPNSFALHANYPNPFNPTTNISYTIPEQGSVKLTVFNMLGQVVATLVNEVQSAGTHEITWNGKASNGSRVVSGVYIYQINSGNNVATRKMMLLK